MATLLKSAVPGSLSWANSETIAIKPTPTENAGSNSGWDWCDKLPVIVMLGSGGKEALLAETGQDSPRGLAGRSSLVLYGDVPQWAALVAERKLHWRNRPPEAGDMAWLEQAFTAAGNSAGLERTP